MPPKNDFSNLWQAYDEWFALLSFALLERFAAAAMPFACNISATRTSGTCPYNLKTK
jgi:hypothetical protein